MYSMILFTGKTCHQVPPPAIAKFIFAISTKLENKFIVWYQIYFQFQEKLGNYSLLLLLLLKNLYNIKISL